MLFEFARSDPGRVRALTRAYQQAGGPAAVTRRGHFSMLIAQLGHITETAATDWLKPNPRSPERTDSAAWISEVLDEPHTRELLDTIVAASELPDGGRVAGPAVLFEVALVVPLGRVERRRRGDLRDDLPLQRLLGGVA